MKTPNGTLKRAGIVLGAVGVLVSILIPLISAAVQLGALTQQVEDVANDFDCLRELPERVASLEAAQRSLETALERIYAPVWKENNDG